MSRVCLASDTCHIYFTYTKVNHLLYTCSLDPFEDNILLDTPLMCMHRYCRSFTNNEEECKRQGTPTPSTREAWKRRRKKQSCQEATTTGRPDATRRPNTTGRPAPGVFTSPMDQSTKAMAPGRPSRTGRSATERSAVSGHPAPLQQKNCGSPSPTGRADPREPPDDG